VFAYASEGLTMARLSIADVVKEERKERSGKLVEQLVVGMVFSKVE
jgi:hypothetical protein